MSTYVHRNIGFISESIIGDNTLAHINSIGEEICVGILYSKAHKYLCIIVIYKIQYKMYIF